MKILAFDLGSHMAVAHNLQGDPRVQSADFKGTRQERAGATLQWLEDNFSRARELGCEAVVYERPFARGFDATRSLWGIAGLIEGCANAAGLPCLDMTPAEIQKHALGAANRLPKDDKKRAMTMAAMMTGYAGDNEHEADAWCLLRFAEDTLSIEQPKQKKAKKANG